MTRHKDVRPVSNAQTFIGSTTSGYVIHVGRTNGPDTDRPFATLEGERDGARNGNGRVMGTYFHGAFANNEFRRDWLEHVGHSGRSTLDYDAAVDGALDDLADGVEASVDVEALLNLAEPVGWRRDKT